MLLRHVRRSSDWLRQPLRVLDQLIRHALVPSRLLHLLEQVLETLRIRQERGLGRDVDLIEDDDAI